MTSEVTGKIPGKSLTIIRWAVLPSSWAKDIPLRETGFKIRILEVINQGYPYSSVEKVLLYISEISFKTFSGVFISF